MKFKFSNSLKSNLSTKKIFLAGSAVCLLSLGSIGGSLAYLKLHTEPVQNMFKTGTVDTTIQEDFVDKTIKKDVFFTNDGSVPVYIRVLINFSWVKDNGKTVSPVPVTEQDCIIQNLPGSDWFERDGKFYYSKVLNPGERTSNLVDSITYSTSSAPDGYVLNVDILSQTIQAYPAEAVQSEWGFVPGEVSENE